MSGTSIVPVLWYLVIWIQTANVNGQIHVELRQYSRSFSSANDDFTVLYEFDEPENRPWCRDWLSFYPYANFDISRRDTENGELIGITGYLYDELLDCNATIEACYSSSHMDLQQFAFISDYYSQNYPQNCSSNGRVTLSDLKESGYDLVLAYNEDDNQDITQEDEDSGFPIVLLSADHALELISYYDDVDCNGSSINQMVVYIERSENTRSLCTLLYILGIFIPLMIIPLVVLLCSIPCLIKCEQESKDSGTDSENVELRNVSQRNRESADIRSNRGNNSSRTSSNSATRETAENNSTVTSSRSTTSETNRALVNSNSSSNSATRLSNSMLPRRETSFSTSNTLDHPSSLATLPPPSDSARINLDISGAHTLPNSQASRLGSIVILPENETDGPQIQVASVRQVGSTLIITTRQENQGGSGGDILPPPLPPRPHERQEPMYGNVKSQVTITGDNKRMRKYDPQNDKEHHCSICLDNFTPGEDVRCLTCDPDHIFHSECLDQSFEQIGKFCPICREGVQA